MESKLYRASDKTKASYVILSLLRGDLHQLAESDPSIGEDIPSFRASAEEKSLSLLLFVSEYTTVLLFYWASLFSNKTSFGSDFRALKELV